MKARKVIIEIPAAEDLEAGRDFYSCHSDEVAGYFVKSMLAEIRKLAEFAGIHSRKLRCYRVVAKRFPFAIYYRIMAQDKEVRVVAILDMRRHPK